ncbi:MAG: hypothetical protein QOG60_1909, partial [Frankiaceae bacterium]|nr:hypothetical protein [Frankiaceae bacterium]
CSADSVTELIRGACYSDRVRTR